MYLTRPTFDAIRGASQFWTAANRKGTRLRVPYSPLVYHSRRESAFPRSPHNTHGARTGRARFSRAANSPYKYEWGAGFSPRPFLSVCHSRKESASAHYVVILSAVWRARAKRSRRTCGCLFCAVILSAAKDPCFCRSAAHRWNQLLPLFLGGSVGFQPTAPHLASEMWIPALTYPRIFFPPKTPANPHVKPLEPKKSP
jgi:hypothetical protein